MPHDTSFFVLVAAITAFLSVMGAWMVSERGPLDGVRSCGKPYGSLQRMASQVMRFRVVLSILFWLLFAACMVVVTFLCLHSAGYL